MAIKAITCLGYHTCHSAKRERLIRSNSGGEVPSFHDGIINTDTSRKFKTIIADFNLVLQAGGYVPLIGLFSGLRRILAMNNDGKGARTVSFKTSAKVFMIVRAVFEALGLGSIFLLPDLAVTAHRFLCKPKTIEEKVEDFVSDVTENGAKVFKKIEKKVNNTFGKFEKKINNTFGKFEKKINKQYDSFVNKKN